MEHFKILEGDELNNKELKEYDLIERKKNLFISTIM